MVPFDECFVTIAETAVAPLAALWWRSSRAGLVLCQRVVQREAPERDGHQCRESDRWGYRQDAYGYLARGEVPGGREARCDFERSEEHTSELQSPCNLVCRLLLEKKKIPCRLL